MSAWLFDLGNTRLKCAPLVDGRVGEVVFPGDGKVLREDGDDPLLGMPRDLDLDDETDAADHADDYRILPVLVRVRWNGPVGPKQLQLVGTLSRR